MATPFIYREGEHWRVDLETGCWEWLKARTSYGYAQSGQGAAHRAVWRQSGRPLAKGVHLHHACHNKGCVNPEHMVLVAPSAHLKHHKRAESPFTKEQVLEIRQRAWDGESQRALAKEFGVTDMGITELTRGTTWADIGGPIGKPTGRVCLECGTSVDGRHRAIKYCSAACRQRAFMRSKGGYSNYTDYRRYRRSKLVSE